MRYFQNFKIWPQSLQEMLDHWSNGFDPKTRVRDLKIVLNYLSEIGKIRFEVELLPTYLGPKPGIVFYLTETEEL